MKNFQFLILTTALLMSSYALGAAQEQDNVAESVTGKTKSIAGIKFPVEENRLIIGFPMAFEELQHAGGGSEKSKAANDKASALSKGLRKNLESIGILLDLKTRKTALHALAKSYSDRNPPSGGERQKLEKVLFSAAIRFLPEDTVANYLASRSRGSSVYETSLSNIEWKGENQFQKLDTGAKFITELLPNLLNKVPNLPIKLRMIKPVWIGEYRTKDQFIPFYSAIPPAAGGDLNLNHFPALVWKNHEFTEKGIKVIPKDAEKVINALIHSKDNRKLAYLQAELNLNPAPNNPASYGVPHLISEKYYLSADLSGETSLLELNDSSIPIPVSERQEIVASINDPLVLNADTALLLILKNNPEFASKVNWDDAMRYQSDSSRRTEIGFPPFVDRSHCDSDIFSVITPATKERKAEAFKEWTLKRAKALPDKPVIIVANNYSDTGIGLQRRVEQGRDVIAGEFGDPVGEAYRGNSLNDIAKKMKVSISDQSSVAQKKDLTRDEKRKISSRYVTLLAGVPSIPKEVDSDKAVKEKLSGLVNNDRYEITRLLSCEFQTLKKYSEPKRPDTFFIALKPTKVIAKLDGEVFYEDSLDAVMKNVFDDFEEEKPPIEPAIKLTIPENPYGPAVKGLRLGMKMSDAIEWVKDDLGEVVECILEADPKRKTPYRQAHMIMCVKTYEIYSLIGDPRAESDRMIAIARYIIKKPKSTPIAAVIAGAEKKYGKPVRQDENSAQWYDDSLPREILGNWSSAKYYDKEGNKIERNNVPIEIKTFLSITRPPDFNHYYAGEKKINRVFYLGKEPGVYLDLTSSSVGQSASKKLGLPRQMEAVRILVYDYKAAAQIYNEWYPKYQESQKTQETDIDF